ncbi:MAG: zinc ribbon domain-containing protein [Desulfurococcaceae archaeon]
MSQLHYKLGKIAITLTSVSIFILALSILLTHLFDLYSWFSIIVTDVTLSKTVLQRTIIIESLYVFKIVVLMFASRLISMSGSYSVEDTYSGVRFLLFFFLIYVTTIIFIFRVLGMEAYLHELLAPEAFYISLIVALVIAYFMKKADIASVEGKALYVIGSVLEIALMILIVYNMMSTGLPYIEIPSLTIFVPSSNLVLVISLFALFWIVLTGFEIVVFKVFSPVSKVSAAVHLSRKITLIVAGLIVGVLIGINLLQFSHSMINLFVDFKDVKSSFIFATFISSLILATGLTLGVVSGVLFLVNGLKAKTLLSLSATLNELKDKFAPSPAIAPEPTSTPPAEMKPEPQPAQPTERIEEEKVKCPYCGAEIPKSAKFCPNCGAYLLSEEGTRVYSSQ